MTQDRTGLGWRTNAEIAADRAALMTDGKRRRHYMHPGVWWRCKKWWRARARRARMPLKWRQ